MAPQAPVVAQWQTPTQDRLRSLMRLTGGNNAIQSEEAARRQAQLALQRDVQREASNAAVQQAIAERKRQQWLSGERTLADEEAGAVAPSYAGKAVPFNPNGVNNGIAYRGGAPVGFSGAVPGVAAIPEAGFNPAERTAFNRQLMNMASQSAQASQPIMPSIGEITGPIDYVGPVNQLRPVASSPVTAMGLPLDTPDAAAAASRALRGMPSAPIKRRADATIQDLRAEAEAAALSERRAADIVNFEQALPTLLEELTLNTGALASPQSLANQILADAKATDKKVTILKQIADRLELDPETVIAWAKSTAARS